MSLELRKVSAVLDQLDTHLADAEERLLVACRYCDDNPELATTLEEISRTRREFRRQLRAEVRALGDSPSDGVSLHRGFRRILAAARSAIEKDSLRVQLEECRLGAFFAVRDFENALELDLPERIARVLERQLTVLREDLAMLEQTTASGESRREEPDRGRLDCFGLTHVGKKRLVNQDEFLIAELRKSLLIQQTSLDFDEDATATGESQGQLLAVADGIGGHAAGDDASTVALEGLREYVLDALPWFLQIDDAADEKRLQTSLRQALRTCQQSVLKSESVHPERAGMGTTLTLAYVLWPKVYVVHAGDSRCYLQRDHRLERLTTDHTVAQRLVDVGELDEGEANRAPESDVLWNALGVGDDSLETDVYSADLRLGDTLLLCSDGLTKHVSDERILEILRTVDTAEKGAEKLLTEALEDGGSDNITTIVGRFEPATGAEGKKTGKKTEKTDKAGNRGHEMPLSTPSS